MMKPTKQTNPVDWFQINNLACQPVNIQAMSAQLELTVHNNNCPSCNEVDKGIETWFDSDFCNLRVSIFSYLLF